MDKGRKPILSAALALIVLLCCPALADASSMTVSPTGNGAFVVEGGGISGASAVDFAVTYDLATLANPRVVPGPLIAGSLTAVNTAVPGTVRMAIIRLAPVSGSGVIATITFDRQGAGGGILSFSARLADSAGSMLPVVATIAGLSGRPDLSAPDGDERDEAAEEPAQSEATVLQPVIIAGPTERSGESGTAAGAGESAAQSGEQDLPGPEEAEDEGDLLARRETGESAFGTEQGEDGSSAGRALYVQESILSRFESYRGERTAGAFIALFSRETPAWCRQEPPVAVADGRTAVRVTFITTPGKKTAADVAVLGARLIALRADPGATNTWTAEVVPDAGEYRASVAISPGGAMMVCPLTTAPGIAGAKRVTRAGLARYIGAKDAAGGKARDLNGDGKRDYIDDYIMTANYLAGVAASRGKSE